MMRGRRLARFIGPFQLHYASNIPGFRARGLGDDFTRDTHLDARKMENWKAAVDYALDHAKKVHSWRDWHGFDRHPASEGLDYRPPPARPASPESEGQRPFAGRRECDP